MHGWICDCSSKGLCQSKRETDVHHINKFADPRGEGGGGCSERQERNTWAYVWLVQARERERELHYSIQPGGSKRWRLVEFCFLLAQVGGCRESSLCDPMHMACICQLDLDRRAEGKNPSLI